MIGAFFQTSGGRNDVPIHSIPNSVTQALGEELINYYSIIRRMIYMKKALSVLLAVLLFFAAIPARAENTAQDVKMRLMDSLETPPSEWFESSLLTACMCVYIVIDLSSTDGKTKDGVLPSNGLAINWESGCYASEKEDHCMAIFHLVDGRILFALHHPYRKLGRYDISEVVVSTNEEFVSVVEELLEDRVKPNSGTYCYVPFEDLFTVLIYIKDKLGIL